MSEEMTIVALKGADRIRKRPFVVFGDGGSVGARNAFEMMIDIFVDEAVSSSCSNLQVTVFEDKSIAIKCDDRGFLLDETIVGNRPDWQNKLCDFFALPRHTDEYIYAVKSGENSLYGEDRHGVKFTTDSKQAFDFCCVQYASRFLKLEVVRGGKKQTVEFCKGEIATDLKTEPTDAERGTYVHFLLDEEVFGMFEIERADVVFVLRNKAICCPTLCCELVDKNDSEKFSYPEGIKDYAKTLAGESAIMYYGELEARGKDRYNRSEYDARVKVALAFAKNGGKVYCWHNYKSIEGGRHLIAARETIEKYANWHLFEDKKADFETLKNNVVLLIETNCTVGETKYETARQMSIDNKLIADMTCDLFGDDFAYFLEQNKEKILGIIG